MSKKKLGIHFGVYHNKKLVFDHHNHKVAERYLERLRGNAKGRFEIKRIEGERK